MIEIDKEMIERYELYKELKQEFEKIYRYRWAIYLWNTVEWHESTDPLWIILYKNQERLIDLPELIEELT